MTYSGPKRIVILGGGIAGLAAADAITAALAPLARAGDLPPGIEVLVVEGDDQVGGRAMTWRVTDLDASEHPQRHAAGHTPHGIHFLWHSYTHFLEWSADARHVFSPERPISTYCSWLAPPDLVGPRHQPGRVVAIHVCDPKEPATAWDPRARALLEAFRRRDPWVSSFESFMKRTLLRDLEVDDLLSFLDILFDERTLSPQLRWGLLLGPAVVAQLGRVETSEALKGLLGGRRPQDVDVSELTGPLFENVIVARLKETHAALAPYLAGAPGPTSVAPIDSFLAGARSAALSLADKLAQAVEAVLDGTGILPEAAKAALELMRLLARDTNIILDQLGIYDPRTSGYLKNVYKAAFSSPYEFDAAVALRDVQMGFRNFTTAKLQVFDGDDAQALWNHVRARIEARAADGVAVQIKTGTWAKAIELAHGAVARVQLTESAERAPPPISTSEPAPKGAVSATVDADVVVSTLLPSCLKPLLPKGDPAAAELRHRMAALSRYANETVNLQLFFPRRMELPFVDPPNAVESRPFSISNLEGIYTILVDLSRAWRPATFRRIRLKATDTADFTGTGWELVGSWADVFTHDSRAAPARYQWPLGTQLQLAKLAHDPDLFEPWSVDSRPWALDVGNRVPPPFGEVRRDPAVRQRAFDRWVEEVGPIVVAQTLRQLAALPGMARDTAEHLTDVADDVAHGVAGDAIRWVFHKSAHAETKFFSAEPHTYELRPHARYETSVKGLWCAGDWTRSGLNVQAMEAALVSGLQSAAGVLEAMRAGGLTQIRGPRIMPGMLPNGAWDSGP